MSEETELRARAEARIGTVLHGKYRVDAVLGIGGMGAVFATTHRNQKRFAVKILHPELSLRSEIRQRFVREGYVANSVEHPGAVAILDDDVAEDGAAFLVMELLEGATVERVWEGLGHRIRPDAVLAIATQLLDALAAAHAKSVVHRDIKPANLFLQRDGTVKVLDFGIARIRDANATVTNTGALLGTPAFMAPEQASGETSQIGGETDVWAVGATLFALLSGKFVRIAESVQQMIIEAATKPARSLASVRPDLPPRLVAIVDKALAFDRRERWSATAMREAVARAHEELHGAPVSHAPLAALVAEHEARLASPTGEPASGDGAARGAKGATPGSIPLSPRAATLEPVSERLAGGTTAQSVSKGAREPDEPPPRPAPPRRDFRQSSRIAAGLAVLAVVGAVVGLVARSRSRTAHVPATSSSASAAVLAGPGALETPSQMSSNPEATAAYRAGVQAFRDASLGPSLRHLNRAIELDPLFAAAHLRLALTKIAQTWQLSPADLQPARQSRASLSERDRTLLDALEPWLTDSPDFKETERRLHAAVRKYPTDTELAFELAHLIHVSGRPKEALKNLDEVIALDPTFALALMENAQLLLELGDLPAAFQVYAQCMKVSPGTTSCLGDIATVQAHEGKCADLIATSRQCVALNPTQPEPYQRLAEGLVGTGEPLDVVRAALRQQLEHEPPADRRTTELTTDAALSILTGDFSAAARTYEELEKVTASESDDNYRFFLIRTRMLVELEAGRNGRANDLAKLYLRQRTAWSRSGHDYTLPVYEIQRAAGGITAAKFDELRDQWLARNEHEPPYFRWFTAYASATATPEDARAALAAKPERSSVISSLDLSPDLAEPVGLTDLLAGDLDEAIRYLSAASSSCTVLDGAGALFSTWGAFNLGRALEARGDTANACLAYGRVLARWGAARPASRTAANAMDRRGALGCGP